MLTSPYQEEDRTYTVASRGGDDHNPAWFLNLRDNPDVTVSIEGARPKRCTPTWPIPTSGPGCGLSSRPSTPTTRIPNQDPAGDPARNPHTQWDLRRATSSTACSPRAGTVGTGPEPSGAAYLGDRHPSAATPPVRRAARERAVASRRTGAGSGDFSARGLWATSGRRWRCGNDR